MLRWVWRSSDAVHILIAISDMVHLKRCPAGITFRPATSNDIPKLSRFPKYLRKKDVANRMKRGHTGVVGTLDGEIVFQAWLGVGKVRVNPLDQEWAIPDNEVFFYGFHTCEDD